MNDPMDCDKDGNAVTLADIFKDGTDVAEEAALNIELDKMYRYIDDELDEREKEILTKRYGLSKTSYRICSHNIRYVVVRTMYNPLLYMGTDSDRFYPMNRYIDSSIRHVYTVCLTSLFFLQVHSQRCL